MLIVCSKIPTFQKGTPSDIFLFRGNDFSVVGQSEQSIRPFDCHLRNRELAVEMDLGKVIVPL